MGTYGVVLGSIGPGVVGRVRFSKTCLISELYGHLGCAFWGGNTLLYGHLGSDVLGGT